MLKDTDQELTFLPAGTMLHVEGSLCTIQKRTTYTDGSYQLIEYTITGHPLYSHIEYCTEDPSIVTCTVAKLEPQSIGLPSSPADLLRHLQDASFIQNPLHYDGVTFDFEEKWQAQYVDGAVRESVTLYEFSSDVRTFITCEHWVESSTDPVEIFLSKEVRVSEISQHKGSRL